tara:strand:- start:3820 stop:4437 length:618 start_codon:yes stop_codon:yes gene_type:complete
MNNQLIGCFISIPKCASKTILQMFELGNNRDNHHEDGSQKYIIYENHQRLKILENKFDLKNVYTFAFVRHPYDRIKSWYFYHKATKECQVPLNEWIENGCKTHWITQNKTNWKDEELSPLLQYNFIDGNKKLDYIGKIENFEDDCKNIISELNSLLEKNNLPKRIKYTNIKINTSNRGHDDITDENKLLIYKMFKKDFDYFGYEK